MGCALAAFVAASESLERLVRKDCGENRLNSGGRQATGRFGFTRALAGRCSSAPTSMAVDPMKAEMVVCGNFGQRYEFTLKGENHV
jgi:hypothetical protein